VNEKAWAPRRSPRDERIVAVRIAFAETVLRESAKRAGGRWNPDRKLWDLPYRQPVKAGLADRIVTDQASTDRCHDSEQSIYAWMPGRHLCGDAGLHG
jgi:hypothetical protein